MTSHSYQKGAFNPNSYFKGDLYQTGRLLESECLLGSGCFTVYSKLY